jgi:hypothetical protein
MKIVRYNNDCVILDRVLGVELSKVEILFAFEHRKLFFKDLPYPIVQQAYNKIIDFLQNDEKLLDLTYQKTQCL